MSDELILADVQTEMQRQRSIWGIQEHEPLRYFGILAEEVLEACREAQEATFAVDVRDRLLALDRLDTELIQVAAVACSFVSCLDRAARRRHEAIDTRNVDLDSKTSEGRKRAPDAKERYEEAGP